MPASPNLWGRRVLDPFAKLAQAVVSAAQAAVASGGLGATSSASPPASSSKTLQSTDPDFNVVLETGKEPDPHEQREVYLGNETPADRPNGSFLEGAYDVTAKTFNSEPSHETTSSISPDPRENKPPNVISAIASHVNSDGKGGGSLKGPADAATSASISGTTPPANGASDPSSISPPSASKPSSTTSNPPDSPPRASDAPSIPQPSNSSASSSSSSSSSGATTNTPQQPENIKYRRQNVVLPSYVPQLNPDNSVVPESPRKQLLQRLFYGATSWIFRRPLNAISTDDGPRRHSVLEKLVRSPHLVRRIAIIGVHGWFPGRFLQRVVGEPTGTSGRFVEKMSIAVRSFFSEKYNIMLDDNAITLMPLEGEGKVERRVEILYRQLTESTTATEQRWRKRLWDADMVFVVAHSQGTAVSTLLLARLIREGLVDTSRQKVNLLAMAGITHGPFPALKSSMIVKYFEADAARELFEFNDANSDIARKYYIGMRHILASGVRVVALGSWYDQVVPLYSAVMHGFHHPNIYRALYIDGADYTPDFLSHLVVFGLKLRNAGLSDHNLIVHLSDILAGNLYGFGTQGHSAIYEEINTYMIAVAWAMGAKSRWSFPTTPDTPSWTNNSMISQSLSAPLRLNPYFLPWIMARLVDDPHIAADEELKEELNDLVHMFEMWEPTTKQLKEIRYRLEPLRSKL
ncbi:hypothetical protein DFS34DRAFT_700745 [Phlyctochytrium arcticum]|nr:hypothetical protein DFS34DRAFT_700745 [Phlyctochytrium arcticum]